MKAMILAAGRGERMRPLTDSVPKPLLEAGGKPLLVWHVEKLVAAGVNDIVINHSHLGHMIEAALGDGQSFGAKIRYSPEPVALDTAGGVANARRMLGDAPFLLISGDIWSDYEYPQLVRVARDMKREGGAHARLAHQILSASREAPPYDYTHIESQRVRMRAMPSSPAEDAPGARYDVYSGIGVFRPLLFAEIASGARAPLLPLLLKASALGLSSAERSARDFANLTTPADLAELDRRLQSLK